MKKSALVFLLLCITATSTARADFFGALTKLTLSTPSGPGTGPLKVDVDLMVLANESGEGDFHIQTQDLSQYFPDGSPPVIDMTLNIEALDNGSLPLAADFQGITWQLLDRAYQPLNMTDDYFFSSLDSPQELTSIFADLVYNTGLTVEEATWSGGLLPSTDPASVATFQSLIYLDPAYNITAGGGLDLNMRVRLEAAGAAAVPEPAAMLLAILGLALLPRRRRRRRL